LKEWRSLKKKNFFEIFGHEEKNGGYYVAQWKRWSFLSKMVKIEFFLNMAHFPAIFLTKMEIEDECV
jgi:hypothetical protein